MPKVLICDIYAFVLVQFSEGTDSKQLQQQQGEEQASWGFDDDAVNEESNSDGSGGSDIDEDELPEYLKSAAQKAKRRDLKVLFLSHHSTLILVILFSLDVSQMVCCNKLSLPVVMQQAAAACSCPAVA